MSNRVLLTVILLPLLLALAGLGFASTQGLLAQPVVQSSAAASDPPHYSRDGRPLADVPGLRNVPPDQVFDHFLGAQANMTDDQGNPFVVHLTPGTVTAIDTTSSPQTVTITPTGQQTTLTVNITSDTRVKGVAERGSVEAISPGDRVIIATQDDVADAIVIAEWPNHADMTTMQLLIQ